MAKPLHLLLLKSIYKFKKGKKAERKQSSSFDIWIVKQYINQPDARSELFPFSISIKSDVSIISGIESSAPIVQSTTDLRVEKYTK